MHAERHHSGRANAMTTPHVTQNPLVLEPVEPDPFIEAPSRPPGPTARRTEREQRMRRIDLVRRLLRVRAGEALAREGARNGWPARRTERP
jgi:hypothetical protein